MQNLLWKGRIMGISFLRSFLTNLLIVIALIPMVIILNSLMYLEDSNIWMWLFFGLAMLISVSYMTYRIDKDG